jgi:hypothetical protein
VRTSGKANDVVMMAVPAAVLGGFAVWLAGGPGAALKMLDGFFRELADFVASFF